jgi:hypothetical protein
MRSLGADYVIDYTREDFTPDRLVMAYVTRAASLHTATRRNIATMTATTSGEDSRAAYHLGRNIDAATGFLSAAGLLQLIADNVPWLADVAVQMLWETTPEAGALNGEWEDHARELLDLHGVAVGRTVAPLGIDVVEATRKDAEVLA